MPGGVTYAWTVGTTAINTPPSAADQSITRTLSQLGVTAVPTAEQTLTVKCTVSHASLAAGTEKTFSPSTTPPAIGTETQLLSNASSPVDVVAWLDTDGTSIKYYAEGYTDNGTGIPLNADCSSMFFNCSKLTSIDMSGFDTSSVTNMTSMFTSCFMLETIYASTGFDTSSVTTSDYMFGSCTSLKGGGTPQTVHNDSHEDKEYARIDGGSTSTTPGYFTPIM